MNLVYLVAYGDKHRALARDAVNSLLEHGYDGDLLIISDRVTHHKAKHVQITEADLAAVRGQPGYLRTFLLSYYPAALDYEYVLYIDTDVRCIAPIVLPDTIAVQRNVGPFPSRAGAFGPWDWQPMARMHQKAAPCAGIVSVPKRYLRSFFTLWQFETMAGRVDDEGALAVVLIREFPDFTYLPARWCNESQPGDMLVHGVKCEESLVEQRMQACRMCKDLIRFEDSVIDGISSVICLSKQCPKKRVPLTGECPRNIWPM